jgi:hypothetical protein
MLYWKLAGLRSITARKIGEDMLLKPMMLIMSALMIAGSSAWANNDVRVDSQKRKAAPVTKSLKTAPGVVVRKKLPNNLEFNALGIVTPALTDGMSLDKIGQSPLVSRPAAQKPQSFMNGFTFTPSGRVGDDKGFTLGVASQVRGVSDGSNGTNISSTAPANYAVGFALGYRGFAIEGGYNRVARATRSLAEGVDVGVSYHGSDWKTSLKVSQEEIARDPYGFGTLFNPERRKAVELGGAYQIGRGVALTGGLRYQLAYPMTGERKASPETDAGAVFLGTAVNF